MTEKARESMRVVVLAGGISDEREISLNSGKNVCAALTEAGFGTVEMLDPAAGDFIDRLRGGAYDVAFPALHGKGGEDGQIQSVLEFYPRFGFERQVQYQWSMSMQAMTGEKDKKPIIEKLDIENPEHLNLLKNCYEKGNPFSKLQTVNGFGLLMLYCGSFLKDCIYYIPEMDAVVIAELEDGVLYCLDIFCEAGKKLNQILSAVAGEKINQVVFKFTPTEQKECKIQRIEDEDDVLFVLKGKENIFAEEKLLFPEIAHT